MDAKAILDQILITGRALAEQGLTQAEQKLGVPEAGPERDAMLAGAGKGAVAAGVLALLLGTDPGRRLGGTALKLGSLAAVGGLAYKAFQDWQAGRGAAAAPELGEPVDQLSDAASSQRSTAILRALIAAAKADGHIDEGEKARIVGQIQTLGLDQSAVQFLQEEIDKPLSAKEVAAGADSPTAGAEIYLASLLVIDQQNEQEQAYLAQLAQELNLAPELVAQLEAQSKS